MRRAMATREDARTSGRIPTSNERSDDLPTPNAPSPVQRPPDVVWIGDGFRDGRWPDEALDWLDDLLDDLPRREPYCPYEMGVRR